MAKRIIYRGLSADSLLAAKKARHKAEEVAKRGLKYITKAVYQGDCVVQIKKVGDLVTVTGIPLIGSIMMAPGYFPTIDGVANTIDPTRLCTYRGRQLNEADTAARMAGAVQQPGTLQLVPSKSRYFYTDHPYFPTFWVNPGDVAAGVPPPTNPRYRELLQPGTRSLGWMGAAEFQPLANGYAIAPGMFASHAGVYYPNFYTLNDLYEWYTHHTSELTMRYK